MRTRFWLTLVALPSKGSFARSMTSSSSSSASGDKLLEWRKGDSNSNRIFLLDGGTGEELFQRGVPDDRKIWSATALVHKQYQDALAGVHRSFLEAGADAITTNSYGVVPGVGFSPDHISQHVATSGRIAREVVHEFDKTLLRQTQRPEKLVLGSMGPLLESYRPDKLMEPPEEGIKVYGIIAKALLPFVDAFIAETMSCVEESSQAIRAVAQLNKKQQQQQNGDGSCRKPMLVSYTLDSHGKLRDGEAATKAVSKTLELCKEVEVQLLGVLFNCATPESISQALESIHRDTKLQRSLSDHGVRIGAYANRLTPVDAKWSLEESDAPQATRTDLDVEQYAEEFVSMWVKDSGATIVGGCCGITPSHIASIHSRLR